MKTFVFPGQGSQQKGMGGKELFDQFGELTKVADSVLGYSIKKLCLEDPENQLGKTQYTQPALFTVNALLYLQKLYKSGKRPDFVAGHSLGEYNALFAAGAFDFETGLKLVQKRGLLMSQARGGGMAAVIGLAADRIEELIKENRLTGIAIANYNSPSQTVISGPGADITRLNSIFEPAGGRYIPLNVSGAFHSHYMNDARKEFEEFLRSFTFSTALAIPVISNINARPYSPEDVKSNLINQMTQPVRWIESVRYLMGQGDMEFEEVGPGNVLTRLIQVIKKETPPISSGQKAETILEEKKEKTPSRDAAPPEVVQAAEASPGEKRKRATQTESVRIAAEFLGDEEFKKDYGLRYAYVSGSMYRGIASKEIVVKMAKAGMMGFFGTGGLSLSDIERAIREIQKELPNGQAYGMNLLHNPGDPALEEKTVDLFLRYGIKTIEASAYMGITPSLVRYRGQGLRREENRVLTGNRIIAKVSRPEIAEAFLNPAPARIVERMVRENKIDGRQADLLKEIPMADDLCVEADSGGHTDGGVAYALMPAIRKLRDEAMKKYSNFKRIRVGAAGGIGTPEAAAAAFILGADFIVTGSINQCTVEAGTSDKVKDMLQQSNVQDTDYAPAGDMFEFGAKVQVLKKGVFFSARANKLYDLYLKHDSIDGIDENTRRQLQDKYFKRTFEEVYRDCRSSYSDHEIERAERNPRLKMAMIFKWYFEHATRLALQGTAGQEVNYQVQCSPAMGAFNSWVKGSAMENWRYRYVDKIALKLMNETAEVLNQRYHAYIKFCNQ